MTSPTPPAQPTPPDLRAEKPSCPSCGVQYGVGSSSGICTECVTGEIGHSYLSSGVTFKGDLGPTDCCVFEYHYPQSIRVCHRTLKEHLS